MSLSQPQPQLQHQPPINLDDGKRHKLDKKVTEEELRRSSEHEVVDDEVSSFEEIMVQKKLVKEGKIEVVENPRYLTEPRRKELERRRKEESTPVVKEEKKKFSLFPHHHHHKSESQAAAAVQQSVVEQDQEAGGASIVPPPSEGSPFKATASPSQTTDSPPKPSSSPSKGWFISDLKGFFGPRQLPQPQPSPTRQRSTKSTKTTTNNNAVVNSRNISSDDSDVEDRSPSNPRGFTRCLVNPSRSKN
jgi:hypothetical protein